MANEKSNQNITCNTIHNRVYVGAGVFDMPYSPIYGNVFLIKVNENRIMKTSQEANTPAETIICGQTCGCTSSEQCKFPTKPTPPVEDKGNKEVVEGKDIQEGGNETKIWVKCNKCGEEATVILSQTPNTEKAGEVKDTYGIIHEEVMQARIKIKKLPLFKMAAPVDDIVSDLVESINKKLASHPQPAEDKSYVPYQTCPKCNGQGSTAKPPYTPGDVHEWASTSATHLCNVCNGAMVIPMLPILENKAEDKWIRRKNA